MGAATPPPLLDVWHQAHVNLYTAVLTSAQQFINGAVNVAWEVNNSTLYSASFSESVRYRTGPPEYTPSTVLGGFFLRLCSVYERESRDNCRRDIAPIYVGGNWGLLVSSSLPIKGGQLDDARILIQGRWWRGVVSLCAGKPILRAISDRSEGSNHRKRVICFTAGDGCGQWSGS